MPEEHSSNCHGHRKICRQNQERGRENDERAAKVSPFRCGAEAIEAGHFLRVLRYRGRFRTELKSGGDVWFEGWLSKCGGP